MQHFVLTIDTPPHLDRSRYSIAQTLREAADMLETKSVIVDGILPDRLTQEIKASWVIHEHIERKPK